MPLPPLAKFIDLQCPQCRFPDIFSNRTSPALHRWLAARYSSGASWRAERSHSEAIKRISTVLVNNNICQHVHQVLPLHPSQPLDRIYLELFITESAELTSWSFNTIKTSLAAASYIQRNYKEPRAQIDFQPIWQLFHTPQRQHRSSDRTTTHKAHPLLPEEMSHVVNALHAESRTTNSTTTAYILLRDALAFALAFTFGLRNNEVVSLRCTHVYVDWAASLIFCWLPYSKTDQGGSGVRLQAPINAFGVDFLNLIPRYRRVRKRLTNLTTPSDVNPLFLALPPGRLPKSKMPPLGAAWSCTSFINTAKARFGKHISGHSFRRGGAKAVAERLRRSPTGLQDLAAQLFSFLFFFLGIILLWYAWFIGWYTGKSHDHWPHLP